MTSSTGSLTTGQIAYEAYRVAMESIDAKGKLIPEWDDLGERTRNGWEAAASAVQQITHIATPGLIIDAAPPVESKDRLEVLRQLPFIATPRKARKARGKK